MFRATHCSSSGAQKLYFHPLVLHTSVVADRGRGSAMTFPFEHIQVQKISDGFFAI
jgi:hypothetical protein